MDEFQNLVDDACVIENLAKTIGYVPFPHRGDTERMREARVEAFLNALDSARPALASLLSGEFLDRARQNLDGFGELIDRIRVFSVDPIGLAVGTLGGIERVDVTHGSSSYRGEAVAAASATDPIVGSAGDIVSTSSDVSPASTSNVSFDDDEESVIYHCGNCDTNVLNPWMQIEEESPWRRAYSWQCQTCGERNMHRIAR